MSWSSWRAAQEIPDREEEPERYAEEITDWSHCEKHGKYPTEDREVFGRDPKHPERMGMWICPLCYADIIEREKVHSSSRTARNENGN